MVAGLLYPYFQCSEMDGANRQVSAEMFQSQFQIGKVRAVRASGEAVTVCGYFTGINTGAPLSFTRNTTNFAGFVWLAFRPTM